MARQQPCFAFCSQGGARLRRSRDVSPAKAWEARYVEHGFARGLPLTETCREGGDREPSRSPTSYSLRDRMFGRKYVNNPISPAGKARGHLIDEGQAGQIGEARRAAPRRRRPGRTQARRTARRSRRHCPAPAPAHRRRSPKRPRRGSARSPPRCRPPSRSRLRCGSASVNGSTPTIDAQITNLRPKRSPIGPPTNVPAATAARNTKR